MVRCLSSQLSLRPHFVHVENTLSSLQRPVTIMYIGFHVKCMLFFSSFDKNCNCQQILGKIQNVNFQNNPPGGSCVISYEGMDRDDRASICSLTYELA